MSLQQIPVHKDIVGVFFEIGICRGAARERVVARLQDILSTEFTILRGRVNRLEKPFFQSAEDDWRKNRLQTERKPANPLRELETTRFFYYYCFLKFGAA